MLSPIRRRAARSARTTLGYSREIRPVTRIASKGRNRVQGQSESARRLTVPLRPLLAGMLVSAPKCRARLVTRACVSAVVAARARLPDGQSPRAAAAGPELCVLCSSGGHTMRGSCLCATRESERATVNGGATRPDSSRATPFTVADPHRLPRSGALCVCFSGALRDL